MGCDHPSITEENAAIGDGFARRGGRRDAELEALVRAVRSDRQLLKDWWRLALESACRNVPIFDRGGGGRNLGRFRVLRSATAMRETRRLAHRTS